MQPTTSLVNFIVPLIREAHELAEQFSTQQMTLPKARQVYFNTLAVYAVKYYLECMGVETDWEASDSWDLVMQNILDTADLVVPGVGKLECRPVLPGMQSVFIPGEVWSERIGYVAVKLDRSLKRAHLLGFTQSAPMEEELPLNQLQPFENLLVHLSQLGQSRLEHMPRVNLGQWFDKGFEAKWQSLEALLGTGAEDLATSLRGYKPLSEVKRAKLLDLGLQLKDQAVALLLTVTKEIEKVSVEVQVHPRRGDKYLPPNLNLVLLSGAGEMLQKVQSRSLDNFIQLNRFRVSPGGRFSIQVALNTTSVTENFVV